MSCELCETVGGELLWQDGQCRVVRVEDANYPGFCRVIWQAHVKEMADLSPDQRHHLMDIVFGMERVLLEIMRPDKINLASLGNLTPHLHWHVIPRFRDDAHFPQPIWTTPSRIGPQRQAPALNVLRNRLDDLLQTP